MGKRARGQPKGVPGACAWVLILFAVGCERSPSPIVPRSEATYIVGTVIDKLQRPLAGAVVSILDGPLAGTTSRSDDLGRFEFKGYSTGRTTLRASRDGFQPQTETAVWLPIVLDDVRPLQSRLVSLEAAIGLEPGPYTLAVDTIDLATHAIGRNDRTLRALTSRLRSRRAAIGPRSRKYLMRGRGNTPIP
jgi:hypothetical protein